MLYFPDILKNVTIRNIEINEAYCLQIDIPFLERIIPQRLNAYKLSVVQLRELFVYL